MLSRISILFLVFFACMTLPAHAQGLPYRTLLVGERFAPDRVQNGRVDASMVVMARGEQQGFQFVVRNDDVRDRSLYVRVKPDDAMQQLINRGELSYQILRVGFVNVPRASTGLGSRTGWFADPLPPQRMNAGARGMIQAPKASWAGALILFKSSPTTTSGIYSAQIEMVDATTGETVAATSTSVEVVNVRLLQDGQNGAMKLVLGFEGAQYWGPEQEMRQGHDRIDQIEGAMDMLARYHVSVREHAIAEPSKTGSYSCVYDRDTRSSSTQYVSKIAMLKELLAPTQPVRILPSATQGCDPDRSADDYSMTREAGQRNVRQDDLLRSDAYAFAKRVFAGWKSAGLLTSQRYVKNPFDEPGSQNALQRRTHTIEVPKANVLLHRAMPNTKVFLADWPQDTRRLRSCKNGQCRTNIEQDTFSNLKMWDGRGLDDPDVWLVPQSRLYGRTNNPKLLAVGYNRLNQYRDRLNKIKRLPGGREIWAYNFYTATSRLPQLSIDAPGTDAQLNFWQLAREGNTGLYLSNSILGWGFSNNQTTGAYQVQYHPGSQVVRKGNPYEHVPYFWHRLHGYAAGWGTFLYPPYSPKYGLTSAHDASGAEPVSSLRLEGLREGVEDGNLITMYRNRFGRAATELQMRRIFSPSYRTVNKSLGSVVWPSYTNASMADRMELSRRAMLHRLAQ